jgi:hypothetical protein
MLIWFGYIDEALGKRFLIATWIILVAALAAANVFWTPEGMKGIFLGGVLGNLNAIGVYRDTHRLLKYRREIVYYIGALTRLLLVGVIILTFIKIFPGQFSIPGIFVGVSIVPISFFILLIQMILKKTKSPPEEGNDSEK